jgi:protein O-GlcNAc transferase
VLRSQNKDTEGAEEAYRKALQINPSDLDSLNNLGLILFRKEEYKEAVTIFDKLSGLDPSSKTAKVNLAAAASRAGDREKAIGVWKELVRTMPARTDLRQQLADALYNQQDFEGAAYHYNQILLMSPKSAPALNGKGLCLLNASKLAPAEASFRASIKADPTFLAAYNNLAVTLERRNKRPEAITLLTKANKMDPGNEEIKANLDRMKASS